MDIVKHWTFPVPNTPCVMLALLASSSFFFQPDIFFTEKQKCKSCYIQMCFSQRYVNSVGLQLQELAIWRINN